MKKTFIIILAIVCVIVLHSCSTMYYVNKNEKFTRDIASKTAEKYGNAFFLECGTSTGSYLWYYTGSSVIAHRLNRGKIVRTQQLPSTNRGFDFKTMTNDSLKAIGEEERKFNMSVLDGDMITLVINNQGEKLQDSYLVLTDEFIQKDYNHPLLKDMVRIIKLLRTN